MDSMYKRKEGQTPSKEELELLVTQIVREVLALLLGAPAHAPMDFTHYRLLRESDVMRAKTAGYQELLVGQDTIITPLAQDEIKNNHLTLSRK